MINVGIAGRFMIEAVNVETGERRSLTPWFNNLITDVGLDRLGTQELGNYCMVGTGTATPSITDTTLSAQLASTTNVVAGVYGGQTTDPVYSFRRLTFRFAAGSATGNLSEIGIGSNNAVTVFSRTLIKDGSGNPTTITVLPTEALDVTYELRLYPPSADSPHTTVISGVTYTGVIRPAYKTDSGPGGNWMVRNSTASLNRSAFLYVYDGAIGASTGGPSGLQSYVTSYTPVSEATYSVNSLVRTGTATIGLQDCNLAGGIVSMMVHTSLGSYQIGFSPAIPKDATKVLTLGFQLSWNRIAI